MAERMAKVQHLMEMTTIQQEILRQFFRFLKDKDAYPQYIHYARLFHERCTSNIYEYISQRIQNCPSDLVMGGFPWNETLEKATFWNSINYHWENKCLIHNYNRICNVE